MRRPCRRAGFGRRPRAGFPAVRTSLRQFGAAIDYDADRAVVGVRSEVDVLTAPTLGDLVDVLIDRGERHVVLDLAGLTFMDAAGLRVIADASARLALSGGSPSARRRRRPWRSSASPISPTWSASRHPTRRAPPCAPSSVPTTTPSTSTAVPPACLATWPA